MLVRRSLGNVEIVSFSGSLDASVATQARKELKEVFDGGKNLVVIDLGEVSFVDSSGLSVLVTALKTARGAGGDVVLSRLSPPVRSILELTRLHRVLEVFDDPETAAARLEP